MTTLRQFSEKERDYHAYQARQNYLRQQQDIQEDLEELEELRDERKKKLEALKEKDAAIQRENQALAEIERLKIKLVAMENAKQN